MFAQPSTSIAFSAVIMGAIGSILASYPLPLTPLRGRIVQEDSAKLAVQRLCKATRLHTFSRVCTPYLILLTGCADPVYELRIQ
jgi:hypothetical protein